MDFEEVLRRRHMTRRFEPTPIDPGLLDEVLLAATRAPSAGFTQGLDLLALTGSVRREAFWRLASDAAWRRADPDAPALLSAPAIVLPVANPDAYAERYAEQDKSTTLLAGRSADTWPTPYWMVDAAFATMLVLLAATARGLGALFFQLHAAEEDLLEGLAIPPGRSLIGALALGWPAAEQRIGSPARRARRAPADVIHKEVW